MIDSSEDKKLIARMNEINVIGHVGQIRECTYVRVGH